MKLLLLVVAVAGIGYFLTQNSSSEINIDSYQTLLDKVETSDVTIEEVKTGANLLAEFVCNDATFQVSGGKSISSCLDALESSKERCESRVFSNAPSSFEDKSVVTNIVKRYMGCVGASS